MSNLDPRASVAEVEAWCEAHGVRLMLGSGRPYATDRHFREHALASLDTVEAVLQFAAEIEAQTPDCVKLRCFRSWLSDNAFWTESAETARWALARQRRVCCRCHETGSFKPRPTDA